MVEEIPLHRPVTQRLVRVLAEDIERRIRENAGLLSQAMLDASAAAANKEEESAPEIEDLAETDTKS